jgi:hypothetical protein
MFEKASNPIYMNVIKKVKEKNKKSVHYLLNIEPSTKKEIDYSNLDLTGPNINIDDKEKNLKIYLKNADININATNLTKKLNEEINELGKKYENYLLKEKAFLLDSNKQWDNYKKKKNLKLSKEDEEKKKNIFIEMRLKEESMSNNDYLKFMKYLNAKKNYYYENDIYTKNYTNDIIYKSNTTWSNTKVNGNEDSPFPIKLKEIANRRYSTNENELKEYIINNNEPKEYGNNVLNNVKANNVYKIFERDFDHFNKKNLYNEYFNNSNEPKEYGNNVENDIKSNKIYKKFEKDFDSFFNESLDI